ncbi:helix-turn-helix domain-containing protein, partial [Candidatus Curtissbacteria bacterium]|nr:helix-turn-helix domain-containing protein [Candidatus Curtissbacteria bacterium]
MRFFAAKEKLAAVREVVDKKRPLGEVSRRLGICRQTLYLWIKKYQKNPSRARQALANHYKSGKNHHRSLSWKLEKFILDLIIGNPQASVHKLWHEAKQAGFAVSLHGIYNILLRYNLQTKELRVRFSHQNPLKTVFASALVPAHRIRIIEEYIKEGKPIAAICRFWHVSRPTFYAWLKRYQKVLEVSKVSEVSEADFVEGMIRKYPRGEEHHRSISQEVKEAVLDIVRQSPTLSVHKIYAAIPKVAGRPMVGHHGIQNLLTREGLNTYQKRRIYAQGFVEEKVPVAPTYVPEIPAYRWRMLFAPFKTVPKLLLTSPLKGSLILAFLISPAAIFFLFLRLLITAPPSTSPIGLVFSAIALTFGIFFFLYSMKYYLTILMVLRLAQGGGATSEGKESRGSQGSRESGESRGLGGQISRLLEVFHLRGIRAYLGGVAGGVWGGRAYGVNPLLVNLEKVKLEAGSRPFVSIHVAIYNEKKVVERLIAACTSQEWSRDSRVDDRGLKVDLEAGGSKVDNPESNFYPQDPSSSFHPPSSIANYEVVIVDDSTDETTEIAKQSLIALGYSGNQVIRQSGEPIPDNQSTRIPDNPDQELFTFTKADGPVVKLIHRGNRSGFKGGALQEALRVCDPKAEYICVFDADFVPYADTIEQFVKTFAVLDGRSSGNQAIGLSGSNPDNPNTPAANSSTSEVKAASTS